VVVPLSAYLPDLAALELLADTVRLGGIGAAARLRGISQQAASQRLRGVEAQVGVPLLVRTVAGTTATPSGAVLTEWAGRLLEVAAEVDLALMSLRTQHRAHLTVAPSMTVAEHLLPRWLLLLRDEQLRTGLEPTVATLAATNSALVLSAVRDGTADLGFVEGPTAPEHLPWRPIGADVLVVVVAPGHPWSRRRARLTAAELAATPLISRESGSGTRQVLAAALSVHGLVPADPILELSTSTAVREAVRAAGSPAVLSRLAVAGDLASGRLVAVPVDGVDLRRTLRAVWQQGERPPAGPARDLLALTLRTTSRDRHRG
jgi:DNA-binding transcriptional LysR family regulator